MGQEVPATVLIVEDDRSCSELIAEVVQDLGFFARVHDRVEQTLALIRQERPALVILDVVLPDGDGVGVLRAIRGESELSNVPVLLCTAAMFYSPDLRHPAADPYTAVIAKPFHIDAFGRMVMQLARMSASPILTPQQL